MEPEDYHALRGQLNPVYQVIADVLLNTGMRIEEFWYLVEHPEIYSQRRRCISLPQEAIKKAKTCYPERDVLLTSSGCETIETMQKLNLKRVSRTAMNDAFKLAARKANLSMWEKFSPKVFRKTTVSWLIKAVPEKLPAITNSQGHDWNTINRHYYGVAFSKESVVKIKMFFDGWGE